LASQGKLEIVPVLVVSVIAGAVGGPLGYQVGLRWGRELLERPGRRQERRRASLAAAERIYARWGRLAVFMTPSWMAGTARMRFATFVVWNVFASIAFTLSTGPTAYGAAQVSSGHSDTESLTYLIVGLAVAVGGLQLARRYRRAHSERRATRPLAGGPPDAPSGPADATDAPETSGE
jgi:membrane-associated protein